jgi:hypothetical protein
MIYKAFLYACALLLALSGSLLATSCRATREPATVAPTATDATAGDAPAQPPGVVVVPHRSLVDKVIGRPAAPAYAATVLPRRIGKKATITIYNAPATITNAGKKATVATDATVIGKAKAPVATGAGDVTDQAGASAASAIKGNGNAPVVTATQAGKKSIGQALVDDLTGPLGWVIGALALGAAAYGVYYIWWLLPARKQKPQATQV